MSKITRRNFLGLSAAGLLSIAAGGLADNIGGVMADKQDIKSEAPSMDRIKELLKGKEPVRWVFAGDSITHGAHWTFGQRDYVQLFEERLRWELDRRRDFITRTGISGYTTGSIRNDIEWNILQFKPHIVSIMVGMNDASTPSTVQTFGDNYRFILDTIASRIESQVIIHTPNRIVTGFDKRRDAGLLSIVEEIYKIGKERNIPIIDHWTEYEKAWQDNPARKFTWMGNEIHPNAMGHRAFARLMFKELGIWDEGSSFNDVRIP